MTKTCLALLLTGISIAAFAADTQSAASARQYPGGPDEQDLKVQSQLVPPAAKIDRRTMDQKVLQNFLRKSGPAAATSRQAKPKQ